jgi:hypothetical protein
VQSKWKICEWIVDIWRNVRFAHGSLGTICDKADKFTGSAKSGPKVSV